jgi:hypothetical protein
MADLKDLLDKAMQRKQTFVEQANGLANEIRQAQQELDRINSVIIFENGRIMQLQELIGDQGKLETGENGRSSERELAEITGKND